MYYNGKGVLRDFAEAARRYQLAARGEIIMRNCNSPIYTREASVFRGTSQSRKSGQE
jgi:TPR repeat protein